MSKLAKPTRFAIETKKVQEESPESKLNPKQKVSFYLTNIQEKIANQIDQKKQHVSIQKNPFFQDPLQKSKRKDQAKLKSLTEQKRKAEMRLKQISEKEFQYKHKYKTSLKNQYLENQGMFTDRLIGKNDVSMEKGSHPYNTSSNMNSSRINQTLQGNPQSSFQNQFITSRQTNIQLFNSRSAHRIRPKSQLTSNDIQTLKRLKHEYKKFEQQVQNKTLQQAYELEKIRKQNQSLQQMIKNQQNLKKRTQIQVKLKQLQKHKHQRITKFQQENKKLHQLKKKDPIHKKLQKEFSQKEKSYEQKKVELMKERLRGKTLDFDEIDEHQRRYQQMRQESIKEIEDKYLEHSRFIQENKAIPSQISRFYKSVLKEKHKQKIEAKQKQFAPIQKYERTKQYATKVHEQYVPRLRTIENDEKLESYPAPYQDKSLTEQQRRQIGNNYLKQAIKNIKQQHKQKQTSNPKQTTSKSSNLPKIQTLSSKYKDYLSETRQRYSSVEEKEQWEQKRAEKIYSNCIKEVKSLMNVDDSKSKVNKFEKIERIKEMAEKLQHEPNDRNYIDRIRAKLEILDTIT